MGDTVVLVTAVGRKEAAPGKDFLPLTVNYVEKTYAAGRIPGGFFKREGRPTEKETLTSRLIDRPIRPLFPEGFYNEVQVIATVISLDPEIDSDVPAMLGASAALCLSGMPFKGPDRRARASATTTASTCSTRPRRICRRSSLDLVVAGTADAVLMVESEAERLPESVMLGAVVYGHEQMQVAIRAIRELAAEAGKPAWQWSEPAARRRARRGRRGAGRGGAREGVRPHREAGALRAHRRNQGGGRRGADRRRDAEVRRKEGER